MDTSWTASVPSLGLPLPAPAARVSFVTTVFSLFKRRDEVVFPSLPAKSLLESIGLLAGVLEEEAERDTPAQKHTEHTLAGALANLHSFHSQLVAAIAASPDAATDPAALEATCHLATGFLSGTIACALSLSGEAVPGAISKEDAGEALQTCLQGAFILYGILDAIPDSQLDDPTADARDATVEFIEHAVLASVFKLDQSLSPLLSRAQQLTEVLVSGSTDSLELYTEAQQLIHTLKLFADCVQGMHALPRADKTRHTADPIRIALEIRLVAADVAISLMVFETRSSLWQNERTWVEGAQRYVLDCLSGATLLLPDHEGLPLVLEELDETVWFSHTESDTDSEDEDSDDSETDLDLDAGLGIDEVEEPAVDVLARLSRLTDRFCEADEGFRRQCPELQVGGERVDVGRGSVEKRYKNLVAKIVDLKKEEKRAEAAAAEAAKAKATKGGKGPKGKRKRDSEDLSPEDAELLDKKYASAIKRELQVHGVPRSILDEVAPTAKRARTSGGRPRLSSERAGSRRTSGSVSVSVRGRTTSVAE